MIARDIPKESDWGIMDNADRDVKYAHKIFFGKSNDEMVGEFKINALMRCEDLGVMPIIPFCYYIFGLKEYIDAGDFDQFTKSESADCFLELIKERLAQSPEFIMPILPELMPTIEYVAKNQSFFDADIEFYGDFMDKLNDISRLACL